MTTRTHEIILMLLMGALALVVGVWFSQRSQVPDEAPLCDVGIGPCVISSGNVAVEVRLDGAAIYTKDTRLLLRGGGVASRNFSGWVEGRDMMMGYFPLKFTAGEGADERWLEFNLPLCVTGEGMTWIIQLNERLGSESSELRSSRLALSGVKKG